MNTPAPSHRRSAPGGRAVRGVLVLTGLAAAIVLQLAGHRLQSSLASLVGIARIAPSVPPAGLPTPMPARGYKVAQVIASAACDPRPAL